ncbi:amphi-Trp domain-containing protein [Streptomyces sp. NPDC059828]|uniref:amphi-Trp domain-containing protein n=1 Tax=Streptomyces sp. NPDC059828 TaxID=3346965 RepID=UPI0036687571
MKDLKFEQKRSLSRHEAADQLESLAAALRQGEDAELELGPGKLSLRIPDDLRSEIEVEVSSEGIELEIEFKWPTARAARPAPSKAAATPEGAGARRRSTPAVPSRKPAKRSAKKSSSPARTRSSGRG